MGHNIQAACASHIGKIRKKNEDNFCFNGNHLEMDNDGITGLFELNEKLSDKIYFAVFDGIGGENFGEVASYAAVERILDFEFDAQRIAELKDVVSELNIAVVKQQQKFLTDRMGTTMASIHFSKNNAIVCNVGDSRVYRYRRGRLLQLSVDHNERHFNCQSDKTGLTQYLGMDPEEVLIEPHILKRKFESGDIYLLCTDGLSGMLTDFEICDILSKGNNVGEMTDKLIASALENGGRDNVTAIVCLIK